MSLLSKFRGWDLEGIDKPWGDRPSIHQFLLNRSTAGDPEANETATSLPDEEDFAGDGRVRWAAGALDGVANHHFAEGDESATADEVSALLQRVLKRGRSSDVAALYQEIKRAGSPSFADSLIERIAAEPRLPGDRLEQLGLWLAKNAADREPVKLGIAILGLFEGTEHHELFHTLGRHEEFTLYSAVALVNSDPAHQERNLFDLAREVEGWGRIHLVERLSETRDPEIKAWLLREGYRNSVMYEYLAHICATTGDLLGALSADTVDEALLRGAGDLLSALITGDGGPSIGISAYADAPRAIRRYLDLLEPEAADLEHLLAVATIHKYLVKTLDTAPIGDLATWPEDDRFELLDRAKSIIELPTWPPLVERGLEDPEDFAFYRAAEAGEALGIDTWEAHYRRTEKGGSSWWALMQTEDKERIEKVIALAQRLLPLEEMASGPGLELGLGPQYADHSALGFVLQDLHVHPGMGWPLIRVALQSPVVRNRHLAIRALEQWDRRQLPSEAHRLLSEAHAAEPDPKVQERLAELLKPRIVPPT